jgi:hypothetical protein
MRCSFYTPLFEELPKATSQQLIRRLALLPPAVPPVPEVSRPFRKRILVITQIRDYGTKAAESSPSDDVADLPQVLQFHRAGTMVSTDVMPVIHDTGDGDVGGGEQREEEQACAEEGAWRRRMVSALRACVRSRDRDVDESTHGDYLMRTYSFLSHGCSPGQNKTGSRS